MKYKKNTGAYLLILVILSILTIFLFYKFSTEDSYITYRYAQHLVDGKGFVYNPGEEFLGTTAPFYALLLAFFGFLGFNIPSIGGILSAFSLGMAIILIYLLTLKKGYPLVGLLCGLFMFMNPWFLMTFGSETYFQFLMIISAFYFYDRKKFFLTAIFCALAFLTRSDGIIPTVIISIDYIIRNKKLPVKEIIVFISLCAPFFLYFYLSFNTFLPSTLEAKQAQYASGLWEKFLPGIRKFSTVILNQNMLFKFFIPLLIIGGIGLLFFRKTWLLIFSWALLHTASYIYLKVPFYHWYCIPLIFLLMLMSAFSIHFLISVPHLFKEGFIRKNKIKMLNQEINLSIVKFKEVGPYSKWIYRILSFGIIALIALTLFGGIKAYYNTYKSLPFPKLELYAKAGQWIAENTPPEASVAFLEVGYFGYHSQRKIIDLVGLVTPGVSKHIQMKDFKWAIINYSPDYFIYNPEFEGWLKSIIGLSWFKKKYKKIREFNHPGFSFTLQVFKKTLDSQNPQRLSVDSYQDESNFPVGEIVNGVEIGQTFYCENNNLAQIEVMLATYNRENHKDVIFHLKNTPSGGEDIYTENFNSSSVKDNEYRAFDFSPIPDSKGKKFYFYFDSPQSSKENAITIWASQADKYDKGSMYVNGKKAPGDLRFIIYFHKNQ